MRKSRKIKNPLFSKKNFSTLSEAQKSFYKSIKRVDKSFTWKKAKQILNKNTITASKNKGYSFTKVTKKAQKYLEKNTKLSYTDIDKASARISRSAILKQWKKEIFNNWDLAKKDKSFKKAFDYLVKINEIVEANNFEIFKNTKLITDAFGKSYTFSQLISPTKNFVKKIQNHLVYIDYYLLEYLANKKNLKILNDALLERFLKDPAEIGKFKIDISLLNLKNKKTDELVKEFDAIESVVFDKSGTHEPRSTHYFDLTVSFYDSENAKPTSIKFTNNFALDKLVRIFKEDEQKGFNEISEDLENYEGLAEAINAALKGDFKTGEDTLGDDFNRLKKDIKKIVSNIKLKLKGKNKN